MARRYRRAARLAAVSAVTALAAAACSSVTGTTTTTALSGPTGNPVRIGISLPLTGQFQADGLASEQGYQLWASDVNAHGGLLGRPVTLVIRDDKSDPAQTAKDYTALITQDHVDLTLAPFSTLLTTAALKVTDQYHYALPAGSAGGPSVFAVGSHSLFSTNVPAAEQMVPVVNWLKTLPPSQRPATAAYPMVDDPFADPPVQTAMKLLPALGVRTVYSKVYSANSTPGQLAKDAAAVAALRPQMVVLGSVDVPTVSAFVNTFAKLNINPKIFLAAAGPDQGQAFINAVGTGNAPGVLVPNGWSGAFSNALSHVMVQDYIAKFGGTASDINADVAEAYGAGEVLAAGVTGAGTLDNGKIGAWLHSHGVQTVTGPARFAANGENLDALSSAFIFQWQPGQHFVQVLPSTAAGSVTPLFPKPAWGG